MIKTNKNIIILDVRNETEYNLGHLYNAILIPLSDLESRINELPASQSSIILVYCAAGSRSGPACQILGAHGFTKIYNVTGGINAWMQADYPIATGYHRVLVDFPDHGKKTIDIQPLLLYQEVCLTCSQEDPIDNTATNVQTTIIDEHDNYSKLLINYEVAGETFEYTVEKTLLWRNNKSTADLNRTIEFTLTEITEGDVYARFYTLNDDVQCEASNLTIATALALSDLDSYNASFTLMSYEPADKTEIVSLEEVTFNSPMTL
jgi:rhodanese-related sulfurtransferase